MAVGQQDGRQATSNNGGVAIEDVMNGQPLADNTTEEDVGDEQRLENSLKILKEMHIQVSSLRLSQGDFSVDVRHSFGNYGPLSQGSSHL